MTPGVLHDECARRAPVPARASHTVQGDLSRVRGRQSAQHTDKSRLADAILPGDATDLSSVKISIKFIENWGFPVGEAQVAARKTGSLVRRGPFPTPSRGHPSFWRPRINEGTQAKRTAFFIRHGIELLAAPTPRHRASFHEKNLIGKSPQEVKAMLDNDNRHALFFQSRKGPAHISDGSGIQV